MSKLGGICRTSRIWGLLLLVQFFGAPSLVGQAARWTRGLELDLVIPSDGLVAVPTAATDRLGHLYLSQPLDHNIKVFDDQGRLIRVIGRRGQGPGEFERVQHIGFRGDTLFVTDPQLDRVTFIVGDEVWTEPWRSPALGPYLLPEVPVGFFSDGSAFAAPTYHSVAVARGELREMPLLRLFENGDVQQLVTIDIEGSVWGLLTETANSTASQPFSDHELWALKGDGTGVFVIDRTVREGFGVTLLTMSGDTAWSHHFDAPRPRIGRGEIEEAVRARAGRLSARFGSLREREQGLRATLETPDRLRAATAATSGTDGSLWLRMEREQDRVCWWIVDSAGELSGSVQVRSLCITN